MAFFSLITKHLLKSKDIANDLNASKRNSRKREKGKHEEYERMKQGPAENMTEAVLKEKVKELPSLQRPKNRNFLILLMPLTIPLVDLAA